MRKLIVVFTIVASIAAVWLTSASERMDLRQISVNGYRLGESVSVSQEDSRKGFKEEPHVTVWFDKKRSITAVYGDEIRAGNSVFKRGFCLRSSLRDTLGKPVYAKVEHGREILTYELPSEGSPATFLQVRIENIVSGFCEIVDYHLTPMADDIPGQA